jgi:hypothetical protein
MQNTQQASVFSSIRKIFAREVAAEQAALEMRALTEAELRAVAGGPECDVGTGL